MAAEAAGAGAWTVAMTAAPTSAAMPQRRRLLSRSVATDEPQRVARVAVPVADQRPVAHLAGPDGDVGGGTGEAVGQVVGAAPEDADGVPPTPGPVPCHDPVGAGTEGHLTRRRRPDVGVRVVEGVAHVDTDGVVGVAVPVADDRLRDDVAEREGALGDSRRIVVAEVEPAGPPHSDGGLAVPVPVAAQRDV